MPPVLTSTFKFRILTPNLIPMYIGFCISITYYWAWYICTWIQMQKKTSFDWFFFQTYFFRENNISIWDLLCTTMQLNVYKEDYCLHVCVIFFYRNTKSFCNYSRVYFTFALQVTVLPSLILWNGGCQKNWPQILKALDMGISKMTWRLL